MSREVEEGRRDAAERRGRSHRGVVVEDDGAGHLVIEEGATGDLPARIAEMEAEIRTLRETNKSEWRKKATNFPFQRSMHEFC